MSEQTEVTQTPEQASTSLSAGFNEVRGTPPTEPTQESSPEATQQEAAPEVTTESAATEPEVTAIVEEPIAGLGLTPSEVKARLAAIDDIKSDFEQRERKLLGHMGSLKSELMKSINEKTAPAASTATLKATFKHLREAGYDDVADNLEKDIGEIQSAPAGTVDAEEIAKSVDGRVSEALAKYRKEVETERFTERHPDWKDLAQTDDFKLWRANQPPEVQQELAQSVSANFLSSQFDKFKAWKKKSEPKQKNASRLEGNLAPQGAPAPSVSALPDQTGLRAGFDSVRRPRPQI